MNAIKTAIRLDIKELGGIEATAIVTGYSTAHVGRWHNRNQPDLPPLLAIIAIAAELGHSHTLAAMARAAGLRLMGVAHDPAADLLAGAISANADAANLTACAHAAIADGKIDAREREQLIGAAGKLSTSLDKISALLDATESD